MRSGRRCYLILLPLLSGFLGLHFYLAGTTHALAQPDPAGLPPPVSGPVTSPPDSRTPIPEIVAPPARVPTVVIPAATARRIAYNRVHYTLIFVEVAWSLAGLLLLLRVRAGTRLRDEVVRRSRNFFVRVLLFWAVISALLLVWNLPLHIASYLIERSYGFATHGWERLAQDVVLSYLIGLADALAVWVGYLLLRRSPTRWWLWLWLASIPWQFTMIVLYPVVISPLFNQFRPLPDGPLRTKLLDLASQAGIEGARVYEVDISKRTTRLNAYVAGLGPTKRIVLWDTTLKALKEDEILAIMVHEMGHYVLRHTWWRLVSGVAGAFLLLFVMSRLLPWAIQRWGQRTGIQAVYDLAGLPLLMMLMHLLLFLQTPVASAISRYQERQADGYGLELTHLNEATARAFVTFVSRDFADPDPPAFIHFWFGTHPTLRERVEFALRYKNP
jgi:STE24 endopeptidase